MALPMMFENGRNQACTYKFSCVQYHETGMLSAWERGSKRIKRLRVSQIKKEVELWGSFPLLNFRYFDHPPIEGVQKTMGFE